MTPKSFTLAPNQQYGNRLVVDLYDNAADANPTPVIPDTAANTAPAVPVSPAKPEIKLTPVPNGKRDIVVVIDAGHGGKTLVPRAAPVRKRKRGAVDCQGVAAPSECRERLPCRTDADR